MEVFHTLSQALGRPGSCGVAIGNFDGIHLGHRSLLNHLLEHCRARGLRPAVLTFYPHPVEVLNPEKSLPRLTTTAEKLALLEELGVDLVLVEKFDAALAALEPEDFFRNYLRDGLEAKAVFVGFNFRFGHRRRGDNEMLGRLCREEGLHLHVEPPFALEGERVSSTAIRQAIQAGNLRGAERLLGRPYGLSGSVVRGAGRGRGLGFPTANLRFPREKVLPGNGVYVTRAVWRKQAFPSVTNVGVRPTVDGTGVTVEVHILNGFHTSLYDEELRVEFLDRIRDEKKFASLEALKAQITEDAETARQLFRRCGERGDEAS